MFSRALIRTGVVVDAISGADHRVGVRASRRDRDAARSCCGRGGPASRETCRRRSCLTHLNGRRQSKAFRQIRFHNAVILFGNGEKYS